MNAGSADKREADRLLRLLVRQRESCERCGRPGEQVAHVLGRRANATRCLEENTWWLCGWCHPIVDSSASEHAALVVRTIGAPTLGKLNEIRLRGPEGPLSAFWRDEVERLRKRIAEEGL